MEFLILISMALCAKRIIKLYQFDSDPLNRSTPSSSNMKVDACLPNCSPINPLKSDHKIPPNNILINI